MDEIKSELEEMQKSISSLLEKLPYDILKMSNGVIFTDRRSGLLLSDPIAVIVPHQSQTSSRVGIPSSQITKIVDRTLEGNLESRILLESLEKKLGVLVKKLTKKPSIESFTPNERKVFQAFQELKYGGCSEELLSAKCGRGKVGYAELSIANLRSRNSRRANYKKPFSRTEVSGTDLKWIRKILSRLEKKGVVKKSASRDWWTLTPEYKNL